MKKADLIVAASANSADMLYACGFVAPDPFIYFSGAGETGIILSALEQDRAEKDCRPEVAVYGRDEFSVDEKAKSIDLILALAQKYDFTGFRVPGDFPLKLADELRAAGMTVTAEKEQFFPHRQFKNRQEVEYITDALRVTETSMRRAINIIGEASIGADGALLWHGGILTSELLRSEINIEIIRNGGIPDHTIVAGGRQGAEPHNVGSGTLYAGQSIIIDIFPRMSNTGYWGDLTRTLVKGKAPDILKKAFAAVLEARERAKELIRPGAIPAEIHKFANEILARHGFLTGRQDGRNFGFFHGLGHGVGLKIHESPRLSPANHEPLKGGEVVTVEPGLYYPEWGGVRLEDMVAVCSGGCNCLTEIETVLEID